MKKKVEIEKIYPLSPMQEGMLFHSLMEQDIDIYLVQNIFTLKGNIDPSLLEKSIKRVLDRFEMLRTVFRYENVQKPLQIVLKGRRFNMYFEDTAAFNDPEREQYLETFIKEDREKRFDLTKDLLTRISLLKSGENTYRLIWDFHHIIMDGWCLGIVYKDLFRIYSSLRKGENALLEPSPSYRMYSQWLARQDRGEGMEYWQKYLEGFDTPAPLPGYQGRDRETAGSYQLEKHYFSLDEGLTHGLSKIAGEHSVTLNAILQTLWGILLQHYTNSSDVVFGKVVSGRPPEIEGIEQMVGLFINTVPVRVKISNSISFSQLFKKAHQESVSAKSYEYLPLADIQGAASPGGELIDHIMVFENYPIESEVKNFSLEQELGFSVDKMEVREQTNYNFNLILGPGKCLQVKFLFNSLIFDTGFIERMERHLKEVVGQVVENPHIDIKTINILTEDEKRRILEEFNDTTVEFPRDKTIHELFEEQAEKVPDSVAVIGTGHGCMDAWMHGNISITFRELSEKSDQLAHLLIEKGVLADHMVGIMVERSIEMIIGILGILKAGGAYLPIDPDYPQERIDFMLKDSGAKILLTNLPEGHHFHYSSFIIHHSDHLAYVMYTSGTTGEPKGVLVTHKNVVRLVKNTNYIELTERTRILRTGAPVFDATTFEIWGSLLNGGQLVLTGKEVILNARQLGEALERFDINTLWLSSPLFNQLSENDPGIFSPLAYLLVGGDVLSPTHINRLRKTFPGLAVINGYGPTENTTFSTTYHIRQEFEHTIPIGRPIANSTAYIVDRNGHLQPIGVSGELVVGGDGVSRGYLNNPELTAERFVLVCYKFYRTYRTYRTYISSKIIYRTGDLARWLPDGNIEFFGRMDQQVKIRGFRVELTEIENRLLHIPEIKEAVVTAVEERKNLCAYIVLFSPEQDPDVGVIREELSAHLPDYMVPSYFVFLDRIPLTPNGKIDRRALPIPEAGVTTAYTPPRNAREEKLAAVWAEVLNTAKEKIGIDDDFFQLGGHSLKATILISKIHKELDTEIPLREVFQRPTIRGLSDYINRDQAGGARYEGIESIEKREYYALSSAQKRLYFLQRMAPESTSYNIPLVLPPGRDIEKDKLERSLKRLIARHESLRTSFVEVDNVPVQRIHDEVEFEIEYLAAKNLKDHEGIVGNFIRPFDLSKAPLIRSALIGLPDGHHVWMVDTHHIVSDGTSHTILAEDFISLYKGEELEPLRLQYKDFSQWQNRLFASGEIDTQKEYWLERFADAAQIPRLQLTTDYKRPEVFTFAGAGYKFKLDREEAHRFKELAARNGATLYMNILTVLNTLFYKYTGQTDVIIGSGVAGRPHADLQHIIGMFVNTLSMRNYPEGEKTYESFLKEVIRNSISALENQDFQFEELVDILEVARDPSRNPLFDISMVVQNFSRADREIVTRENTGQVEVRPGMAENLPTIDYSNTTAKLDMTFFIHELEDGININIEYYAGIFKEETIKRLALHFKNIIKTVSDETAIKLKNIELISEGEKKQVLYEFNAAEVDYPRDKSIHQLFEEQVEKTPDRVVAVHEDWALTYKEMDRKANQLARYLYKEKRIQQEERVGIWMSPSLYRPVSILGVLKAGAAYVPIDASQPQERIKFMIDDASIGVVISEKKFVRDLNRLQWECKSFHSYLCMDEEKENGTESLSLNIPPGSLAYIIYTSGTTGKPKGVMIGHGSVVNLCCWHNRVFEVTGRDQATLYAGFGFDAAVWEMFPYLVKGASLHIIDDDIRLDIRQLGDYYEKNHITISFLPTQFCQQFMEEFREIRWLRVLLTGGDKLNRFVETGYRLVNNYGPTENTVVAASCPVEVSSDNIPIGKPIANTAVYILNKDNLQLQPVGVPGELCIAGDGLARGYLNSPELTAEKFVYYRSYRSNRTYFPGKIYKTGDLARWLPDGNIEFLGRIDHQVKIRGFRIELGEIENRLMALPGVKEAVVLDREDVVQGKYLCAYVVFTEGEEGDVSELREALSRDLPHYMVPSYVVRLERIPLTPTGKVNRRALPEPVITVYEHFAAPETNEEKKLAELWAEILGIEKSKISIHDNFFELGGHSLKATILTSRVHKAFDVKLPLPEVFKTPTIKQLAHYIRESRQEVFISIKPLEKKEYYPMSSAQKRLYVLQQMETGLLAYNMPQTAMLEGELDKEKLEKTFRRIIQRHESLRTSFHMIGEDAVQKIHDRVDFAIEYYDLATEDTENTEKIEEIHNSKFIIQNSFLRPFDLSQAPLMRLKIIKTGESTYILMRDLHHIINDGTSEGIFQDEFMTLYGGKELPPLRIQYKEYAVWQQSETQKEHIKQQEEYWIKEFERKIPVLSLPTDFTRPVVQSFEGHHKGFLLEEAVIKRMKQLAADYQVTLFMVLLSLYTLFLARLSGQEDIVVGTPVAGREHTDLQPLIGMFVNTLALRNYPTGEKTFSDFLEEVRKRTLKAFENQEYLFEDLVEKVKIERDTGRNPIFDVMLTLPNMDTPQIRVPGLNFRPYPGFEHKAAQFDMTLLCVETGNRLSVTLEYCTKLFKESTIERFLNYFENLVLAVLDNPDQKISDLEMVSVQEREQILYKFNDTAVDYPADKTIHQLFEEQAERTPERIAVVGSWQLAIGKEKRNGETVQLTYGKLNQKSDQVARLLKEKGLLADNMVGIMVKRSIEMIIGILGILKAGGAYLPIDPDYPEERIDYMLKDSNAAFLLTGGELSGIFKVTSGPGCVDPAYLCYVIYTSGSTGRPKGVPVTHRNVAAYLNAFDRQFALQPEDIVVQQASYAFDAFVEEMYPILLKGGALAIPSRDEVVDIQRLVNFLIRHGVTLITCSPLMLSQLNQHPALPDTAIRTFISGGDRLKSEHIDNLLKIGRVFNTYGPTEATVCATYYRVADSDGAAVPIGKPIPGYRVYILDAYLQPVPVGVNGELCIAGAGIARGYLTRPELTAERFVDYRSNRSYRTYFSEKIYRTGDLARWLADGNIEFLGRTDFQVKIRGFRIELGEIENRLLRIEAIKEAVVIAREEKGDPYLCAYIVTTDTGETGVDTAEIKDYLSRVLPDYMVPVYFVGLEAIPLTPNGKVDRKALPEPQLTRGDRYAAPRTLTEKKLAEIWADILDVAADVIGIDSGFFELGGHSLKATVMIARIQKEFNVKFTLAEVFRYVTVRQLARCIKEKARETYLSIKPAAKKEYYPVSSAQKRLYILQEINPDSYEYNSPMYALVHGHVDINRLKKALYQLTERHEILRTSIRMIDLQPVQVIHPHCTLDIEYMERESKESDENFQLQDQEMDRLMRDFIRPFDLSKPSLFRVRLIKVTPSDYLIMVDMHHIITDGVSLQIFMREFMALYAGRELQPVKLQYADFSEWQNDLIASGEIKKQEEYWLRQFEGDIPRLDLPLDYLRSSNHAHNSDSCGVFFEIPAELTSEIKKLTAAAETTPYMVLLAIYNILLSRYSGQEDIVVGSAIAGRRHSDLENIMGMFVNMLVMRNYPQENLTFLEFLDQVKTTALNAYDNQDYQFDELVHKLGIEFQPGRNPLFDTQFTFQNAAELAREKEPIRFTDFTVSLISVWQDTQAFDLGLNAAETKNTYSMLLGYLTALFKHSTIENMAKHYVEILEQCMENKNIKLKDISISLDLVTSKVELSQEDVSAFEF
jgi:amino acid adenylation domain-containing protein